MKANPIIPLTEEQRQFAAEHEYLIWSFIRWKNLGFGNREQINDWYFVLAESYLNAVRSYKGISTFKVFAYSVMWYSVLNQLKYERYAKRCRITVGLSEPVGEDFTLEETLAAPEESVENMAIAQVAKEELWTQIQSVLPDKQLEATLLRIRCDGDIELTARYAGIKRSTLHGRLCQARECIKEKIWGQQKVRSEATREKIAASRKKYQKDNKEKIAAHKKAYREANKEKCAAQSRKYQEANKEKIAAHRKAYREANKEKCAAQSRKYQEVNKEKIAAHKKAYREANKEKITAQNKARYAKKKALREQELQQGA